IKPHNSQAEPSSPVSTQKAPQNPEVVPSIATEEDDPTIQGPSFPPSHSTSQRTTEPGSTSPNIAAAAATASAGANNSSSSTAKTSSDASKISDDEHDDKLSRSPVSPTVLRQPAVEFPAGDENPEVSIPSAKTKLKSSQISNKQSSVAHQRLSFVNDLKSLGIVLQTSESDQHSSGSLFKSSVENLGLSTPDHSLARSNYRSTSSDPKTTVADFKSSFLNAKSTSDEHGSPDQEPRSSGETSDDPSRFELAATSGGRDEASVPTCRESASPLDMKQERGESPALEAATKAFNLACTSALSNAVLSLQRLTGTSSSSSGQDADAAQQHLSAMLQGLPLFMQGLGRLGAPAVSGLPLPSGSSPPGSSLAAGGGGIQCSCGIRFSCRSNMEAHKKFYCTHQAAAAAVENVSDTSISRDAAEGSGDEKYVLRCTQCPYSTTHKLSLNGHMNMHTASAAAPDDSHVPVLSPKHKTTCAPIDARAMDRYCTDCDIQFSSLKTFKVHKTHYCQTRHVVKANKSPIRDDQSSSTILNSSASGQPILLLPTDPALLVPYSLLIGASLLPSHILPQQGAAVLTRDGQIHPLSLAHLLGNTAPAAAPPLLSPPNFNISASVPPVSTASTIDSPQVSPRAANHSQGSASLSEESNPTKPVKMESHSSSREPATAVKRRGDGDCPLDLTTKRSKLSIKTDLLSDEEKENREVNTPSLTNSPATVRNGSSSSGSAAGDTESKLLSSPRDSPLVDETAGSTLRSPRPASAAPSLSSPRTASHESPRPSTSSANRSSSRQSPTLPHTLSQISPGYSGVLGGIEGLASLPFTGLQYLQGLQGVAPELLLKMFNGMVPPVPPPITPASIKQGEARCNECNITFYKEENYLVHKKHYCAARDKANDEDRRSLDGQSPGSRSRGSISPPNRSIKTEGPAVPAAPLRDLPKTSKSLGQFVCNPCGIKFTTPDNLSAHQTYYCPKREGSTPEEGVTKGMWRCPRCRVAMPETLQAAHQCVSLGSSSAHGWKCPCCPTLSPTAAAAQKHLETHAGIKAFRCTICGYRGNTLRGMRTHIRMHFEKRTNDLQEENFIECILEEDERRYRMNSSQEMRRNLSDHQQALLENSPLAAAILSNSGSLMPEGSEPALSCTICPYVTNHRDSFIKHLALVHKLGVELKNFLESQAGPSKARDSIENPELNCSSVPGSSPPISSFKLEPEVKLEIADSEEDSQPKSPAMDDSKRAGNDSPVSSHHSVSPPSRPGSTSLPALLQARPLSVSAAHHCHACNISFSQRESYQAHKTFYCTRQQSSTPPETAVQ
ncbi:hypothetical protein HAZT_HAZT002606, partial [Hyalella azteca]